ncbi:MAG: hypothetical protein IIV19_06835, partial [Bacteroidaceae bacterium]|nr:hypothetical protein [Bacteroidaceae bacterium]
MKKIIFTILLFVFILPSFAQRDNLLEDGRRWVTFGWSFGDYDDPDDYIKWYIFDLKNRKNGGHSFDFGFYITYKTFCLHNGKDDMC